MLLKIGDGNVSRERGEKKKKEKFLRSFRSEIEASNFKAKHKFTTTSLSLKIVFNLAFSLEVCCFHFKSCVSKSFSIVPLPLPKPPTLTVISRSK